MPLIYEQGRDIDPSLLAAARSEHREGPSWWLPEGYDFAALSSLSNSEWASRTDDLPQSSRLIGPVSDSSSQQWILLEGYPQWSARPEDEDDNSPYREIWMHVRGYLVAAASAQKCLRWLEKQDLSNRSIPEGAEFHNGFLGEYPWGIPFNLYPDEYMARSSGGKLPTRMIPVCNSVSSCFDEDATMEGSINILVPARLFFEGEAMRWDGVSGFGMRGEPLRFLDPSVTESGRPALLGDRAYVLDYLRRTGKCLERFTIGLHT